MRAEIVSIGSELLLGQIVDTPAAFIAKHLAGGLDLFGGDLHRVRIRVGHDSRSAASCPGRVMSARRR